jgi:IclR family transcriptional regulator, blcABC operon repressor
LTVPAIYRAASVLNCLAETGDPLSFTQLADSIDMPRSSLHNVCMALVETGFIERGSDSRFRIGLRVVELARVRLAKTEMVGTFLEASREIGAIDETIVLAVLSGTEVVYVAVVNADRPLAVRYQIGMRLPAWYTATGKAILSTLSTPTVRELFGGTLQANGSRTPDIDSLLIDLQLTRERGYSIDDEETAKGMVCVGVPVFEGGEPHARGAIAFSMVKASAKPFSTELTTKLMTLGTTIGSRLGATRVLTSAE